VRPLLPTLTAAAAAALLAGCGGSPVRVPASPSDVLDESAHMSHDALAFERTWMTERCPAAADGGAGLSKDQARAAIKDCAGRAWRAWDRELHKRGYKPEAVKP
jgi:hypothetical protein